MTTSSTMQRNRSLSYDQASIPVTHPQIEKRGPLTPDRSSRLGAQTSKQPHHRTNFPNSSYNPPVPDGYEPPSPTPRSQYPVAPITTSETNHNNMEPTVVPPSPSEHFMVPREMKEPDGAERSSPLDRHLVPRETNKQHDGHGPPASPTQRYQHPVPQIKEPSTAAFAEAMRADVTPDVSVITEVPFDQMNDPKDEVKQDQPGRIRPSRRSVPTSASREEPVIPKAPESPSPVSKAPAISTSSDVSSPVTSKPIQSSDISPSSPPRPFDEAPAASNRVTPSPDRPPTSPGSNSLLRHARNFQPQYLREKPERTSPLAAALCKDDTPDDEAPTTENTALGYRMTPPRVSVPMAKPYIDGEAIAYEDEPSALTGESSLLKLRQQPKASDYEEFGGDRKSDDGSAPQSAAAARYMLNKNSAEDDDSLFDFEVGGRQKNSKDGNKKRHNRVPSADESDDTSHEEYGAVASPTSLQQRAQAAWRRKQRANAAAAAKGQGTTQPVVSFGKDDIVHSYDPNSKDEDDDADDTFDTTTLGGRSMNSLYTKSAESEVEDIIKDIFLIGNGKATNPGRRKIKHNPRIQERLARGDTTDEESTLNTYDDATYEDTATFTETDGQTDTTGYDTGTTTYDGTATEDNTSRDVSSYLTNPENVSVPLPSKKSSSSPTRKKSSSSSSSSKRSSTEAEDDEKKEDDPLTEAWNFMGGQLSAVGAALGLETATDETRQSKEEPKSISRSKKATTKTRKAEDKAGWGIFDVLLGSPDSFCDDVEIQSKEEPKSLDVVTKSVSLEEDIRLVDLAVQAAKSIHRLNGLEFDSSHEIDITKDIKFSVVDLSLPLGLIFQENEQGCWVTKILPEGSACANGNVQVGDQLAAVDGSSAIDMTVDEIALLIRQKRREIELTFLRYIGPLRPEFGSVVQEEGYEIRATEMKKQGLKKLSFSSQSSKNTPEKILPVKPAPTASSPKSSPTRGILKNKTVPAESAKSKSKLAPVKTEQKKKFRLFGRRK